MKKNQKVLMLLITFTIFYHCNSQQPASYLQTQYISDITRLNQKIQSFASSEQSINTIKPIQVSEQALNSSIGMIKKVIEFQPDQLSLAQNQMVEFTYPHLHKDQNIIDIKVKEAKIQEKQQKVYQSAKQHYYSKPQSFSNEKGYVPKKDDMLSCKINDPQIVLDKIRSYTHYSVNEFEKTYSTQPHQFPRIVYFNESTQQLRIIDLMLTTLQIYSFKIRQNSISFQNLDMNYANLQAKQTVFNNKYLVQQRPFLFRNHENKNILLYKNNLYEIYELEGKFIFQLKKYAQIKSNLNQKDQEQGEIKPQQAVKLIPLKYGFLIQYETYFQIYLEEKSSQKNNFDQKTAASPSLENQSQNPQAQLKQYIAKLSVSSIKQLTKGNQIIDIQINQQPSHQSGYLIFLLIQNIGIIQLQYGSYTSLNIYSLAYGQHFYQLQISNSVIQVIFSITKSKMPFYYIMQLFIDRKQNPKDPKIYLNRFYDDLKDVEKVQFVNSELTFIGDSDILVYDYPINTELLIKENVKQFPYHYAVKNLLEIVPLTSVKQQDSSDVLFIISANQFAIYKMIHKQETIKCTGLANSFDARIEILKYCDQSNRNVQNLCKYIASLRVLVEEDQQASNIQQLKKYLIIVLIVALAISFCIVVKQISKNTKTIQKLRKLKQKINKKYNRMQVKGSKLSGDEKFDELNEENMNRNEVFQENKRKASSQISN